MRMVSLFGKTYLWLYDENMRLYLTKVKDEVVQPSAWLSSTVEYEELESKWFFSPHWTTCLNVIPELSSNSDRVVLGLLVPDWRIDSV